MAYPFILEKKFIKTSRHIWNLRNGYNCNTKNIVYLIQCDKEKCKQMYIGESKRKLKDRLLEHKSYVEDKKLSQATGFHFNLPGHSFKNVKIIVLERVKKISDSYRKEREKFHIKKFNTFYEGLNKVP